MAYLDRYVSVNTAEGPAGKFTRQFKNEKYVTDISDPNVLYDFASYNSIFTLSALGQADLKNTTTLLNSGAHDIIVRSSGIGPTENREMDQPLSENDKKIIDKSERLRNNIERSRSVLSENRDLYIRDITINSIPGLNDKRRLTSVSTIKMEIVEPSGITLLERVRGAAINNGYLDHLNAPYLLTIDFKGFDELGKETTDANAKTMRRLIPIKLVQMQMSVTQAGTVYSVNAIPWTEFGFTNTYNYPRTSGVLSPQGKKMSDVFVALEKLLNKQNEDERDEGLNQLPDRYTITFDSETIRDADLTFDTLDQSGMAAQGATGADAGFYVASGVEVPPDYMNINSKFAITKILEEIMKGHPDYTNKRYNEWKQKVGNVLSNAQKKGGPSAVIDQAEDYYFRYYKIRSTVVPQEGKFDEIRGTQQKHVHYHVETYKVHAYSLAIPGVSTGDNFKSFVFKTYNYIFTGDNVDVLDLNIDYKVAYFQGKLKNFEATDKLKNKIEDVKVESTGGTSATDHAQDGNLLFQSETIIAKNEGTGKTGGTPQELDSFLDYLTHPLADMVNIKLEILGDPAWISQSQFIPLNSKTFTQGVGKGVDSDIDYWRVNRGRIWNDKLRCYNTDVAEPIILLKFRMPKDFNDQTGVYELQSSQAAEFSGLYRVVTVEHNFTDGKYTNVLSLTRFNNQGVNISNPVPGTKAVDRNGVVHIMTENEVYSLFSKKDILEGKINITSIAKKYIDLASANVSRVKAKITNKIKNKIKGFIS